MFATISYNTSDPDEEIRVVPASSQYFGGRRLARLACTECRAKKVKCTGEKTGCQKCRTNGVQCVYPAMSERGAHARRRATMSNSITSNRSGCTSGKKDEENHTSPRDIDTQPPTSVENDGSPSVSSLDMEMDISNALFSPTLPMPSPGYDSLLPYSLPYFDLNSKDLPLDLYDVGDDFGIDLDQLRSPATQPFSDLNIATPPSTASLLSTSSGSVTPHIGQTSPLASSSVAQKILFDIQKTLGDDQPCSCSQSAIHTLEELELKDYNDADLSMDVVLNNQKMFLAQFGSWLDCERCPTPMATSMLLALIIERLSLHLEKGVAQYIREMQQGTSESWTSYPGPGIVGEYQIETRDEWAQVIRVLLLVRCKELSGAVTRLKKRAMLDTMLSGTERRTRKIMSELSSWEG
ncbi:hypothetical protein BCR34DRAFT_573487 [Clohesyomyces aquaticus]|uniref:Zn(2)-C6 fungal-type domain-containing protein n=1 Tax=Clohesyomyces aquaticus TaxID=1231657 RepID=A0A1Y1YZJ6_9PLEO|nr:hypothetical protein BCR34DRAFT_573487 [Clohesyomyces aquaticus]